MGRLSTSAELAATGRRLRLASHGGRAAENTPSEVPRFRVDSDSDSYVGNASELHNRTGSGGLGPVGAPAPIARKGCCGRSASACRRLRDLCDCASKALLLAPLSSPRTDKAEQTACAMVTTQPAHSEWPSATWQPAVRTSATRAVTRARSCTRAVSHDKARWRNLSHCSCCGDRGGSLGGTRGGGRCKQRAALATQGRGSVCCKMLWRLQHAGARRGVREERRVESADDRFRRIRTCAIGAVVCGTMRGRAAWGGTSTYSRRVRAMLCGAAVPIGPTVTLRSAVEYCSHQ